MIGDPTTTGVGGLKEQNISHSERIFSGHDCPVSIQREAKPPFTLDVNGHSPDVTRGVVNTP